MDSPGIEIEALPWEGSFYYDTSPFSRTPAMASWANNIALIHEGHRLYISDFGFEKFESFKMYVIKIS
jgi:hypothetical protein